MPKRANSSAIPSPPESLLLLLLFAEDLIGSADVLESLQVRPERPVAREDQPQLRRSEILRERVEVVRLRRAERVDEHFVARRFGAVFQLRHVRLRLAQDLRA